MWLPSQAQVNAASRNIASAVGGAVLMFGLSTKIDINTINQIISATGTLVNDAVVLIGVVGPFVAAYFASKSASPVAQAAAVAASGGKVVTSPEIAAAVPSPNVMSEADVKVVSK
jgi:hypothetical protein